MVGNLLLYRLGEVPLLDAITMKQLTLVLVLHTIKMVSHLMLWTLWLLMSGDQFIKYQHQLMLDINSAFKESYLRHLLLKTKVVHVLLDLYHVDANV